MTGVLLCHFLAIIFAVEAAVSNRFSYNTPRFLVAKKREGRKSGAEIICWRPTLQFANAKAETKVWNPGVKALSECSGSNSAH